MSAGEGRLLGQFVREDHVRVGLNRESRIGIDLSWKAGVRVNRLWNACIKIRLSLLGSGVNYLVGFFFLLLLSFSA